ncbi:arylsulfatase [Dermatobacter hominis]|uniref:arylsulfatase n=1 Tax=Dermatobacter hominis TaxID=2884263 RepID=UPI001D109900|nr:arylsulfatase [Dermatobacter hominis]UDY34504.1 arylsulfatase [Dermatobacter hominis]
MSQQFGGRIGRTLEESEAWWPPIDDGARRPNVLVILLDDVGYAQLGCYGSDIATPTFDRLAAGGRRFSNFHTTALCSPTRACLLTGRNHHSNGMARVADLAMGFPGYNATIPKENGFLSEILRDQGYATFAVGKWHLAPTNENGAGSPRDRWPLGRGFERFYGFMGGETDQYHPELVQDGTPVEPPATPEDGYHLTEDLADHAIRYLTDLHGDARQRPFFLWFAPGACHAPHQAPAPYIDAYRGHFDAGWDRWRDGVFARQVASGLLPEGTELSERPSWVPPWGSLGDDERRVAARLMEAFAGFLTHTDEQVGRIVEHLERTGRLDDTIVVLMSDNGASAEGGVSGSFNEQYFFNLVPESLEENLARLDELGGPTANNHYPWGWAWAGNTPLKRFKRDTHEGGVADPLIVHWPAGLEPLGDTQHQYVHAIDLAPTLLELLDVDAPDVIAGVEQSPIEGTSFAPVLRDPSLPAPHVTQYYEMLGSRALYHDGWKAVVFHTPPYIAYDGSDTTRPFDEDVWELYHVAEDFSEVHDLAAEEPDRLEAMKDLWWAEAERFQVLPLNNKMGFGLDPRSHRDVHVFDGPAGPVPESAAPHLRNRSFHLSAELEPVADGWPDGAIASHGGHTGGYVAWVRGGRFGFTYNFVSTGITRITSEVELPDGSVVVHVVGSRVPEGLDVELRLGDVPVGRGLVPRTTPLTYGTPGFAVGFQSAGPIDPALSGRAELPGEVLRRVVVEGIGVDPVRAMLMGELPSDLATQ